VRSTEFQLALSPARTYRRLVAERTTAAWPAVLAGPALSVMVIGVLVSIAAAGRVTAGLAATVGASWSFAVGIQALAGGVIIGSSRRRVVSTGRAVELLFSAHLPWSLWLLAVAVIAVRGGPQATDIMFGLAAIPLAWTMVLLAAFCTEVLGTNRRGAYVRTLLHQAIVWSLALTFVAFAAGGWVRLYRTILQQ
jgi:hypothetical protein